MKSTGYPLYSPVSPSLPLPCVTVCHHISTEVYCVFKVYRYGLDLAVVAVFNLHELVGYESVETNIMRISGQSSRVQSMVDKNNLRIWNMTSLVVYLSESLTTNYEVPGSIPSSTVGIFPEGEDSRGDHGLGRLV